MQFYSAFRLMILWRLFILFLVISDSLMRSFLSFLLYLLLHWHSFQSSSLYLFHLLRNSGTFSNAFLLLVFSTSYLFQSFFVLFCQFTCFPILSSSNFNFLVAFHQSVLEADCGKPAELCGLKRNVVVFLFLNIDGVLSKAGRMNLCSPGDNRDGGPTHYVQSPRGLRRGSWLHGHLQAPDCGWDEVLSVPLHVHHRWPGIWIARGNPYAWDGSLVQPSDDPSASTGASSR